MRTALLGLCCCAGCGSLGFGSAADFAKPTIAVMPFENRAAFPLGWNIGTGTQQVLVDRLVQTGRYHVIERPELDEILRELRLQQSGITRAEDRAALGRIKNVQYLVKGVITDFGHVSSSQGWLGTNHWHILGGGTRAVMSMTMYVVDVESGEIVASRTIDESVPARDLEIAGTYAGVGFGGRAFYAKPLGKATRSVIDKAVALLTRTVANQPWAPKIALVEGGTVVINGGQDRKVAVGASYDVRVAGVPIINPDNGDILGRQPGKTVAHVRVTEVHARHSVATIVSGDARQVQVGQRCCPAAGPPAAVNLGLRG